MCCLQCGHSKASWIRWRRFTVLFPRPQFQAVRSSIFIQLGFDALKPSLYARLHLGESLLHIVKPLVCFEFTKSLIFWQIAGINAAYENTCQNKTVGLSLQLRA
jgi:hypothetical protein